MNLEESYLDVVVRSKEGSGKSTEKATRLQLPLTWTENQMPTMITKETVFYSLFGPMGILLYLIEYKVFGAAIFIVYGWLGFFMLRARWSAYKLGPGIIHVDKDGVSDSRLGSHKFLWSSVRKHVVTPDVRNGGPFAILLFLEDSQGETLMTTRCKRANLFSQKSKKARLRLVLRNVPNREEVAEAVQLLIRSAEFA